jgi:DNA modification methylase
VFQLDEAGRYTVALPCFHLGYPPVTPPNTLYYGDNLKVLREHIPDESVDLIYLDPPFNSSRNYNVLFKDESGKDSKAQITAFDDTWHWTSAARNTLNELIVEYPDGVGKALEAIVGLIGTNQLAAYLVMMGARLVELRRVLKPTGSLYLHCDPTASHYLKVILDAIFGPQNFRNEIVWKRTHAHGSADRWGDVHDTVLFYTKSDQFTWAKALQRHDESYVSDKYRYTDQRGRYRWVVLTGSGATEGPSGQAWRGYDPTASGRHWTVPRQSIEILRSEGRDIPQGLHECLELLYAEGFVRIPERTGTKGAPEYKYYLQAGQPIQDVIVDIPPINSQAAERLGYPTQKPLALLERIIKASSNKGDVVLDPFCGCGTAIDAAQGLGRRWIGIDITSLSTGVIKDRLEDRYGMIRGKDYRVVGEPVDVAGARALFLQDPYQFQWWALNLVRAKPLGGTGGKEGKKGSDGGIDGVIAFREGSSEKFQRVIVQVKGGGVQAADVQQLESVVRAQKAAMGLFVTLHPPTGPMKKVAVEAGPYHAPGWHESYPRIQILTIEDLLNGAKPQIPGAIKFNEAARAEDTNKSQFVGGLFGNAAPNGE